MVSILYWNDIDTYSGRYMEWPMEISNEQLSSMGTWYVISIKKQGRFCLRLCISPLYNEKKSHASALFLL